MKTIFRYWIFATLLLMLSEVTPAQENVEVDAKYRTADTNNAVIEGRVSLPSGFGA